MRRTPNSARAPAVAGTFYPAGATELRREVRRLLAAADRPSETAVALVAPHAGYEYSGPVAASAYRSIQSRADEIARVVLAGPSHYAPVRGVAVPTAGAFETPLGRVEVDREALAALRALPQVVESDAAHAAEHSLEVHLPFLQEVLGDFRLVPLAVGDASPAEMAEVLELLWDGPETLVVVSTDLSHFHDYVTARELDDRTCAAVESLRPEDIGAEQACGRAPLGGLLRVARARHLAVHTLDLCSSGDTGGPRDRVVGYGAWAIVRTAGGAQVP